MSDIVQVFLGMYTGISIFGSIRFYKKYSNVAILKEYLTIKELCFYIWILPSLIVLGLLKFIYELDFWDKRVFKK